MSGKVKLSPRLREALASVGRYEGRNLVYWWRPKSMQALADLGLTETYRPPSLEYYRGKRLPYRITEAGRQLLQENDHG